MILYTASQPHFSHNYYSSFVLLIYTLLLFLLKHSWISNKVSIFTLLNKISPPGFRSDPLKMLKFTPFSSQTLQKKNLLKKKKKGFWVWFGVAPQNSTVLRYSLKPVGTVWVQIYTHTHTDLQKQEGKNKDRQREIRSEREKTKGEAERESVNSLKGFWKYLLPVSASFWFNPPCLHCKRKKEIYIYIYISCIIVKKSKLDMKTENSLWLTNIYIYNIFIYITSFWIRILPF